MTCFAHDKEACRKLLYYTELSRKLIDDEQLATSLVERCAIYTSHSGNSSSLDSVAMVDSISLCLSN